VLDDDSPKVVHGISCHGCSVCFGAATIIRPLEDADAAAVPAQRPETSALDAQLTDAALADASGTRVFERGRTYAAAGAVDVIEESSGEDARIRARIAGTQVYETVAWLEFGELCGACDCAHAASGAFCKHLVALCLVWRDRLAGKITAIDETAQRKVEAVARAAQTRRERRQALHEFLRAQPASALAERLIDLTEQFPEIARMMRVWQTSTTAAADPKALRAAITDVLTIRSRFLSLDEVPTWVAQAESILPLLREARTRDARVGADLALHALRRAWAAQEGADDSNGEIGRFCATIGDEWVACLQASGELPAAFGDAWLALQLEDPFGSIDVQVVREVMSNAALARYRKSLAAAWEQTRAALAAPPATGKRSAHRLDNSGLRYRLDTLERMHVDELERMGDVDGALAVLRSDLSKPHRCLAVTVFLEKHNRMREAFASAEDAWRRFPEDWRTQDGLLRAYERDGWFEEAHALRRKQFEHEPSLERYQNALESCVRAGLDRATVRAELFQFMEQLEAERLRASASRRSYFDDHTAGKRNVTLRAHILLAEGRVSEALDLVQPPAVCDPRVLRALALQLGAPQHDHAVALLQRVFDLEMRTAQTPYAHALTLVREIVERQDAQSRARWLAELRVQFKAKRNFIKGLPT
jgi:uncharacterized Zn finger protein